MTSGPGAKYSEKKKTLGPTSTAGDERETFAERMALAEEIFTRFQAASDALRDFEAGR